MKSKMKSGRVNIKIKRKEKFTRKKALKINLAIIILAILSLFLLTSLLAQDSKVKVNKDKSNISEINKADVEKRATNCLKEAEEIMKKLMKEGFFVQRVNDSLKEAKTIYHAQLVLKNKGEEYDFSLVFPYCEEIKKIKEYAFKSRDELLALKKFYRDSLTEDMNTSSVDSLISEIEDEIRSERYEKVEPLINKAYREIIEIRSNYSTLKLFYKTTTRSLRDFFYENRYYLASIFGFLILIFLVYRKAIRRWWIKKKISELELRKKNLKELIAKTQRDYFQDGKISEELYNIKIKKYGELIRDIDRQIPLLEEELIEIGVGKRKKVKQGK